jgi:hypothetical protein
MELNVHGWLLLHLASLRIDSLLYEENFMAFSKRLNIPFPRGT